MRAKRILVTGATGFIGSHLTELCVKKGFDVVAFDRYNPNNHWGWLEESKYKDDIDVILGDVRDYDSVSKAMEGCDVVFHLAALIGIPYSYVSPLAYIRTNVEGTYNILEAAKYLGLEKVLVTSTSETYGTAQYVPIDEKHPLQPQSPYSASKIAADAMAKSFHNAFELPLTIARPFNTYGPRQSARAVIPTIITQIASGKKQIKLGDLTPTRDLSYVEDICRGFIALAECEKAIGETVNIGSNFEIAIGDVVENIKEIMNSNVQVITENARLRPEKSEVFRLWCDNTKIRELTGFEPKYSIKEGLKKTIDWFTDPENLRKYKTDIYNV